MRSRTHAERENEGPLSFVFCAWYLTAMHFTDLAIQIIADDKIRSAIERGEFDRLPGLGRPLHFDPADDPDWWIRRKLRDENFQCSGGFQPPMGSFGCHDAKPIARRLKVL
jgi:hypothetical protein